MTTPHLVLFDADRIKDYVFATGRLKELRGASEQVRLLTDFHKSYEAPTFKEFDLKHWDEGAAEGVIYASAGAGAVLFRSRERAVAFCEALEAAFRRTTVAATLSAVWAPVEYGTRPREQAEAMAQEAAARKLARHKVGRPHAELIPGGGPIRFCASDRQRPAAVRIRQAEGEPLFASMATKTKHGGNADVRTNLPRSAFWRTFKAELTRLGQGDDHEAWLGAIHPDQSLGTIASQARPKDYVAFVYVDGDRVGKTVSDAVKRAGFAGYRRMSLALAWAATQATAEALAKAYSGHPPADQDDPDEPGVPRPFLPFEVITVGGDDVILVCTGEHGVAVAHHICVRFAPLVARYLAEHGDPEAEAPNASAGVVIAHASLPIVQLERRARELLRSAKRREEGGVDFHVVSTPALAELKTVRDQGYRVGTTGLTSRPYSREALGKLLSYARHLRLMNIPGSKRADLYRAGAAPRIQATIDVLTVQARMAKKEREALMETLLAMEYGPAYPFRRDDDRDPPYHTALLDLLELIEFVSEEGQWGAS